MSFTASMTHVPLSMSLKLAMGLAVWILYAADRLMDTRCLPGEDRSNFGELELRHHFHHQHRALFLLAIALAIVALTCLLPSISRPALHLYLFEASFVAGYFVLIHRTLTSHSEKGGKLPKEWLVGPFFAAASFIPILSARSDLRWPLLPIEILFTGLCCLNCLYIYAWEHTTTSRASWLTAQAVPRLQEIGTIFATVSFFMFLEFPFKPATLRLAPLACGLSAISLVTLNRFDGRLSNVTLRCAADLALLSPVLLLPFLQAQ